MMAEMRKATPKPGKVVEDRPRGGSARAVSAMLPEAGRAAFRRFGFVQSSVVSRWREIVGERYAGVSAPESIRFPHGKREGGVLTLVVEGAYAPTMQHVAPVITERVNRFFGYEAVAKIAFRQGSVAKVKRPAPPSLRAIPMEPLPTELGDSLRTIADPELRACLEGLARGVAASSGPPMLETFANIPLLGRLSEN